MQGDGPDRQGPGSARTTTKGGSHDMRLKSLRPLLWMAAAAMVLSIAHIQGQQGAPASGEWRYWGADPGNSHYSPLDQIDRTNVKTLKVAWRWKSENLGPRIDSDWK